MVGQTYQKEQKKYQIAEKQGDILMLNEKKENSLAKSLNNSFHIINAANGKLIFLKYIINVKSFQNFVLSFPLLYL